MGSGVKCQKVGKIFAVLGRRVEYRGRINRCVNNVIPTNFFTAMEILGMKLDGYLLQISKLEIE